LDFQNFHNMSYPVLFDEHSLAQCFCPTNPTKLLRKWVLRLLAVLVGKGELINSLGHSAICPAITLAVLVKQTVKARGKCQMANKMNLKRIAGT
jgi:hypothetical protein